VTQDIYRELGQRIRRARESAGLSQEDMAQMLGYNSPATISYFEGGDRRISIEHLQRIAGHLGLPFSYFLEEQEPSKPVPHFTLRATEVRPAARRFVDSFLSFAQKHGGPQPALPDEVSTWRPGKAADFILKEAGVDSPPVSPRTVASTLGVPVYDWDFPDEVSGIYVSYKDTACIGVNQAHTYVRQKYTIAHEIGHLAYSKDEELFVDFADMEIATCNMDSSQKNTETRANQFAADLLMPRAWLRRDADQMGLDVTLLSKRYEVSEQALWFRLLNLKLATE
jgi:Zn-dependent peptidase ImmA (M78 family)/DNA-binding XRE family transcriptional regulator